MGKESVLAVQISSADVQSAPGAVRPAAVHAGTEFGAGHRRFCAPEMSSGDVRDSASVLTRIRGHVVRMVTAAAPQMATIIDNPIQAAAVHWGLKVSLQRLPLKALALMCPLVADFSCRRALYQHCGRRRALQWHPPWTRNMRRSFEGS